MGGAGRAASAPPVSAGGARRAARVGWDERMGRKSGSAVAGASGSSGAGMPRPRVLRRSETADEVLVSASVAKADPLALGADLRSAIDAGVDWLHVGVTDGTFVPKISFGAGLVKSAREAFADAVLDVKLSVASPERHVVELAKAGADIITIHPESCYQFPGVLDTIAECGCMAGVVLNPETSVASVEGVLERVDIVVVMLVSPGWGGPKYKSSALRKVRDVVAACESLGIDLPHIEVDGGVTAADAPAFIQAGANVVVTGGALFGGDDKRAVIGAIKGAAVECHAL